MNLLILGHAGSGKSTLVKNFSEFLRGSYSVKTVNLDPASTPCYTASIDSRKFVRTEDIMKRFNLGINGALMKSMEMLKDYIDHLIVKDDIVLYDTPGQLELFLFTDFGEVFSERLGKDTTAIFLIDSGLCRSPEKYLSAIFQSAVISLRTGVETITIFNKADISSPPKFEEVVEYIEQEEGVLPELLKGILPFRELTSLRFREMVISARNGTGFDELIGMINEIHCSCGDLS
ncbi:hypothetical protein Asulf_02066 [Archaeoglobus sulfaticallidus PM70-1]|uniref:GTPase n=1 Tax=Archaeoglobus sulfaticallidus PM70-1 TaxID=387631 RepID=N0BN51_9EURY|nr:ATP/GTP-binding protein [Archaeoglobus sulfaticallidus]AGK62026.1 hypothetical protein Asulf_02066 [Archaeoglobus sulfaticallidus PM70-1]